MFNVVYTITHGSDANSIEIKSESFHYFSLYWINLEIPVCAENLLFVIPFFFVVCSLFVVLCVLLNSNQKL